MRLAFTGLKKFPAYAWKYVKTHKVLSIVIAAVLIGAVYMGYRSTGQTGAASQTAAQAQVVRGPMEVAVSGTGTIVPDASEDNGPSAEGTVKKLYVKNGDKVKKGDLIAEFTNDSVSLQLEKARLDLEKARLDLETSAGNLSSDTLIAPFAGRIAGLNARAGEDVSKNTVLADLVDDSQLVFYMPADGITAQKAAVGQRVEVFFPDRGETVEGKIIAKGNQSLTGYNDTGRTNLKVALNAAGSLSSGLKAFGTVAIDGKQVDALAVSTLEWIRQTQIKATLSGKISGLNVQEGQVVKKGDTLFSLNSDTNLNQQQAQKLSYQQAQLTLAGLETQVNDLLVKAAIDGIISGLDAGEGDEILAAGSKASQSSSTSSVSIKTLGKTINSEQMKISFPVDEVDIAKVKIGQIANVTVDALPDKTFKGEVTEIAEEGEVTNNVSSFNVTLLMENPGGILKSGMTANVTIITAKKDNVLLIPIEALQERGSRKFVLIPGAAEGDQRQNMKPVSVGLINESFVEITNGLQEGEQVLLPGQQANASARPNAMLPGFGGGNRNPMGGGTRINTGGSGRNTNGGGGGARTGQ